MHSGLGLWFFLKNIILNQNVHKRYQKLFTSEIELHCLEIWQKKNAVIQVVVLSSFTKHKKQKSRPEIPAFLTIGLLNFSQFLVIEFSAKSLRPVVLLVVCFSWIFSFYFAICISTLWNGNGKRYWFIWIFFMSPKYLEHPSSCIFGWKCIF